MVAMRQPRFDQVPGLGTHHFHCTSRVVNREEIFGAEEREYFVLLLREYETYCGVRVLNYTILSNHFHLLLEVPPKPEKLPTADELIERLKSLTSTTLTPKKARQLVDAFRQAQDEAGERAWVEQQCQGLWNLSEYMKRLKQRLSRWYNRRKKRKGTLWEERFDSVLTQGCPEVLLTVSLYIDLNSFRAGLVKEPESYRWSGLGEAMAGQPLAQQGLRKVITGAEHLGETSAELTEALEAYRLQLYVRNEAGREGTDAQGRPLRRGLPQAQVLDVLKNKGRVNLVDYLQLNIRYFMDGGVLGTQDFVEHVFQAFPDCFSPKRRTGARRMRGLAPKLYTLRDLQIDLFNP
jgi:REP element-mobilizing transposase RayT